MSDNFKVSSDIDTLLRKQTKEEAATFLGLEDVSAVWGQVTGTLSNQTDLQGALDTNASNIATNTAAIAINTAKTGITSGQASAIVANTAKVGITPTQASDITANNSKVGITSAQASDITANNAKVGITPTQASEITANTAKVSAEWGAIQGTVTNQTDLMAQFSDRITDVLLTGGSSQSTETKAVITLSHVSPDHPNGDYHQSSASLTSATDTKAGLLTAADKVKLDAQLPEVVTGLVTSGDNSSTIQAVINSVAANGGGDIVIPAGTWEIASTLVISTSNVRLRGEGGGWSQDAGVQGTQAATTLKWIGTEFDGAVVNSGSLDGAGTGVTKNGTRLGTVNGLATSDVAKYQGMLIKHNSSGVYDLIMDSGDGYVEIKAASNAAWADSQSFKIYKPSVMVEVHSVYGDGTTDQQIIGSGVSQIHFDCQDANIGLRVIAASNGVYEDLSFIEPKTAAIYMGVKNIGSMDKPATVSQDPQFNSFTRIVSRNFTTGGEYGGLFVCNGVVGWGSNTSFNNFDDMRAYIKHGDGLIFGSSDANRFHNALVLRVGTGNGEALKFLGSNRSVNDVPRVNRLTQFSSTGGGAIICYGTDTYVHESHDNEFPWLNAGNGTPLPTIETDASCFYNTDSGNEYFKKSAQLVVGQNQVSMQTAREDVGNESLRVENSSSSHIVYSTNNADKWRTYIDGTGDFIISRLAGSGIFKLNSGKISINGERKNIRAHANGNVNVLETDNTILLSATTANAKAILPTSPTDGDIYTIKCLDATFQPSIGKNGNLIEGVDANYVMTLNESVTLQYYDGNWNIIARG